jgi:branched-subunit amino acid aminotransferase/4-amino-4-deoxychorismate lyase
VKEGEFIREDLYSAEGVFITNTTLEVMPVSRVDDEEYVVSDITKLLNKAYREEVNAYVANVRAEGPSLWGYE